MLRILINNFRAIADASIDLRGITVLAGENGCGKSTISKLLYHVLHTSIKFDDLAKKETEQEKIKFRDAVWNAIAAAVRIDIARKDFAPKNRKFIDSFVSSRDSVIQTLFDLAHEYFKDSASHKAKQWFYTVLRQDQNLTNLDLINNNADEIIKSLEAYSNAIEQKLTETLSNRPRRILDEILETVFQNPVSANAFDLQFQMLDKSHTSFFSPGEDRARIQTPIGLQHFFYIDTPWIMDEDSDSQSDERLSYRRDLFKTLKDCKTQKPISKISMDNILSGRIDFSEDVGTFLFRDTQGQVFDLFQCATGIKAFTPLQILHRGNLLNSSTLLILDEPEAHLHPQWVVEYARLLVLLVKHHGVRILVSSHSPAMVAAIQAVAEAEQMKENTLFYLAKKTRPESEHAFSFDALGFEIGPIFESFNLSLDKISGDSPFLADVAK